MSLFMLVSCSLFCIRGKSHPYNLLYGAFRLLDCKIDNNNLSHPSPKINPLKARALFYLSRCLETGVIPREEISIPRYPFLRYQQKAFDTKIRISLDKIGTILDYIHFCIAFVFTR